MERVSEMKLFAPFRKLNHNRAAFHPRWQKMMNSFLLLTLLLSLLLAAPASVQPNRSTAAIQPVLLEMAAAQPEQVVRVIIQKQIEGGLVEQMVEQLGGEILSDLSIIHAFAAQLPASAIQELAANPGVRWISLDSQVASTAARYGKPSTPTNYFLDTLRVRPVWQMGLTGSGIGVAVIDSGISPDQDFTKLTKALSLSPNSSSPNDFYGHGTHVAGIIAGNGAGVNGNQVKYEGLARGVSLYNLKIADDQGMAYESDTVAAMQWVLNNKAAYKIRIVNLSINSTNEQSYHTSPLDAAAEILWFNGVVVVASSGNKGPAGTYNTANAAPANDPFIITVGATDEKGTTSRLDDMEAPFSASGKTQDNFQKPDLLAPGTSIYSVLSKQSSWGSLYPDRLAGQGEYFRLSGTSMAAPMVTGAIALLLQDEPNLTPDQVKFRLINTAGLAKNSSTPYLDVYAAVTGTSTQSANTGIVASQMLWTGNTPIAWNSVNWNSVNWNSVNWNSVNWNSVNWNSVNWNSAVLEKPSGFTQLNSVEEWLVPAWPSPEEINPDETETPNEPWQPQHRVFVPMVNR